MIQNKFASEHGSQDNSNKQSRILPLNRRFIRLYVAQLILIIMTCLLLVPYILIVLFSFKSPSDLTHNPLSLIFSPSFQNYRTIFAGGRLWTYFKNSIVNASGATLIATVFGVPTGYVLAKVNFKGSSIILHTLLGLRFIPYIAIMLPLYMFMIRLRLVGSNFGVIIAYQIIVLPILIWFVKSFFERIPGELEECARIDGCTRTQSFFYVMLPLVRPAVISVMILGFIMCWNEFFIALMFSGRDAQPLTLGIQMFLAQEYVGAKYGALAAWATATTLPVVITSLFLNKYLVEGLGSFSST